MLPITAAASLPLRLFGGGGPPPSTCRAGIDKTGVGKPLIGALLLAATMAVAGCGQKGPLYLPPSNSDTDSSQQKDSPEPAQPQR